jgi:hypothetical protein
MNRTVTASALVAGSLSLSACGLPLPGLDVPQIGEIWDDDTGTVAVALEQKIKEKIFCELNAAVSELNSDKKLFITDTTRDPKHPSKYITTYIPPVPETWGATLTLTLTVEELSALNPGASINNPLHNGVVNFPGEYVGAATVPGNPAGGLLSGLPAAYNYGPLTGISQNFSFGIGGTLSSDATRYDKYTFFYKVKDLEIDHPSCHDIVPKDGNAPENFRGSSLLLESRLGIRRWLEKMRDLRSGVGVSDTSAQQVLTYDIKFDIVTSGNITPMWKLVRVTTPTGSLPLFNLKRERTHEMLLTLGPLSEDKKNPGQLSASDNLAAQIGAAVATAIKSSQQ